MKTIQSMIDATYPDATAEAVQLCAYERTALIALRVIILSGVSGSGKSTYAIQLWNGLEPGTYCKVVSADDFFITADGRYAFDASKLSEAHGACFRAFLTAIQDPFYSLVIVDNTNTTGEEIAPYVLGAQAFGRKVEIHTVAAALADCETRNLHGVGARTIEAQAARIAARKLAPWWKHVDAKVKL